MKTMNAYTHAALVAWIVVALTFTGTAADTHAETPSQPETEQEDDGPIIDLDTIVDLLEELIQTLENWTENLYQVLESLLYQPFKDLVVALVSYVYDVVTTTPSVQDSSAVQEVHQQVTYVTYVASTLVFMLAGVLHITGPVLGVSYGDCEAFFFGYVGCSRMSYAVWC